MFISFYSLQLNDVASAAGLERPRPQRVKQQGFRDQNACFSGNGNLKTPEIVTVWVKMCSVFFFKHSRVSVQHFRI